MKGDMAEGMSAAELVELVSGRLRPDGGSALEGADGVEEMARLLEATAHPDFVTLMVPKTGPPLEYEGVEGFREALADWISPYERYRLELDEILAHDDKVVWIARQRGTTKHGGVEIETPGVSVWAMQDGRVRQTTFYLDAQAGLRAAGLDPDRR